MGSGKNNLDKGGRDGKCRARRKSRGVAGCTSGLQQYIALVSTTEMFKLFSLDTLLVGQAHVVYERGEHPGSALL